MNRRSFVHTLSGIAVVSSTGCLGEDKLEYATIQRLTLLNDLEEPVSILLRIEREDTEETVFENEYKISAGLAGTEVNCVWPEQPIRVMTRQSTDEEWSDYSVVGLKGCVNIVAEANELGMAYFSSQNDCPIRSPSCHKDAGQ